MNSAQISQNIKSTAKSKKIALSKLLSDLNINKNLIYSMNTRGSMPALDTLNRIADYLGVSTEFLITGKEKSTTPGGAVLDLTPRQEDVAALGTPLQHKLCTCMRIYSRMTKIKL